MAESIVDNYKNLWGILPALLLLGTLITNLIIQLIVKQGRNVFWLRLSTIIGIGCSLYSTMQLRQILHSGDEIHLFYSMLSISGRSSDIHLLLASITLFIIGIPLATANKYKLDTGIYLDMVLTTLLGAYMLVIANHWLVVYLSIATITLSASLLIYEKGTQINSILASNKYALYSIIASAIMLFGLSYIYGSTGSWHINPPILYGRAAPPFIWMLWLIGLFLGLSGLLMTAGSFPFQFWVADVYESTNFLVIAYLSTVPKLATLTFLLRWYSAALLALPPYLHATFKSWWAILSLTTMLVGHLAALNAKHAKRLLAYGTIAQTGFLLALILTDMHADGHILYYMLVYSIMNMASWISLSLLNYGAKGYLIASYAGLGSKCLIGSLCFTCIMLALIGIPPTAGFTAKLLLFTKLWESVQLTQNPWLFILWIVSVLGTVISLYYYLKIPYQLFLKSTSRQLPSLLVTWQHQLILLLLGILLIVLFFI